MYISVGLLHYGQYKKCNAKKIGISKTLIGRHSHAYILFCCDCFTLRKPLSEMQRYNNEHNTYIEKLI